jgi:hypothetical protein
MFWGNATALKFVTSGFVVLFLISLIAVTMPLMYVFKKKKGSNSGISLISALV